MGEEWQAREGVSLMRCVCVTMGESTKMRGKATLWRLALHWRGRE